MSIHQYLFQSSALTSPWTPFSATQRAKITALVLSNTSAGVVDFTLTNGAGTTIMTVAVPANNSIAVPLAEPVDVVGLTITAAADCHATIAACRVL